MNIIVYRGIRSASHWFDSMPEQASCYQSREYLVGRRELAAIMRGLRIWIARKRGRRLDWRLGWDGDPLKDFRDLKTYVVVDGKNPVLIAPLWTCEENDRCVFGSAEGANSSDFVYANCSQEDLQCAFDSLMQYLSGDGCKTLHWCFLHETSVTMKLLKKYSVSVHGSFVNTCVNLDYPDYATYVKMLGKHAAQNLRTAYNRAAREGHEITFDFKLHPSRIPGEVVKLYAVRQAEFYRKQERMNWRDWFRWCFLKDGFGIMKSPIGFLAQLKIDGKLAAFMGGMINAQRKMLEVPKLAIDISYKFYSPGLLLMSEIARFLIEKTEITALNMGRGDEKYKLDMGGGTALSLKLDVDLTMDKVKC